jgi:putative membrane protein
MAELDDPRVLFAAERTLLAWSRTTAGMIAHGSAAARDLGFWIGLAFILLGVLGAALAVYLVLA